MPSYMLRSLPAGLVQRAKARARTDETTLDAVLTAYLETYAEHGSPQAAGGRARAAGMSAAERSDLARTAVQARWRKRR